MNLHATFQGANREYAVNLIRTICALAGSPSILDDVQENLRDKGGLAFERQHKNRGTRSHPETDLVPGEVRVVRGIGNNETVHPALAHEQARPSDAIGVFVGGHWRHRGP